MRKKIIINDQSILTILIFILVFFSNNTLLFGTNANTFLVSASRYGTLVLSICLMLWCIKRKIFSNISFGILVPLLVIEGLNVYLGKSSVQMAGVQATYVICAFFLHLAFEEKKIMVAYCRTIFFLATASIIIYVIGAVPFIVNYAPKIINTSGIEYYFLLFGARPVNSGIVTRSIGIFWESGTFCIFLNMALYEVLFDEGIENKSRYIVVIVVAELLTFSTGGIACEVFILVAYMLLERNDSKKKYNIILTLFGLFTIVMIFWGDILFEQVLLRSLKNGVTTSGSSLARFASIVGNINIAMRNPILGSGYSNIQKEFINESIRLFSYDMRTNANANTILYRFAVYGVVYGMIMLVGMVRCAYYHQTIKRKSIIIAFIFIIVLFMNENMQHSSIPYIIMFYGYNKKSVTQRVYICI